MARFLDEEFGPPMLLRAARAVLEAQQLTETLGTTDDAPQGRARLHVLIQHLEETAQLHHWAEEDDILTELGELSVRLGEGADLLRPMRAGLQALETRLQTRLLASVAQNWRRQEPP